MTALLLAVFSASLLGSLHCAGMCGPFVVLAVGPSIEGRALTPPWRLQAAYHIGRLLTYSAFGIAAGAIGASVNLGGSLINLQKAATVLAAATLVLFGVVTLLRALGLRDAQAAAPRWMTQLAQRGHRAAWALTPLKRGAGHRSAHHAAPVRLALRVRRDRRGNRTRVDGRLGHGRFLDRHAPANGGSGRGLPPHRGPTGRKAPLLTSLLLIGVGLFTLAHRASLVGLMLPAAAQAAPVATAESSLSVPSPNDTLPCCHGH
ncbi:MAG: sulfite exporter TauE/SafE family protein [Phycisphaerales bacterium]